MCTKYWSPTLKACTGSVARITDHTRYDGIVFIGHYARILIITFSGLRYVTETQSYNSYDPPKYKCSLCDVNVSKTFIITHITGHQHRLEYIVSDNT